MGISGQGSGDDASANGIDATSGPASNLDPGPSDHDAFPGGFGDVFGDDDEDELPAGDADAHAFIQQIPPWRILTAMNLSSPIVFVALLTLATPAVAGILHDFAKDGDAQTVTKLVEAGVDPDTRDENGATPLHIAAWNGKVAVIEALVAAGADVNARVKDGGTPLHTAAWNGQVAAIDALVAAGADVNAKADDGSTPLDDAVTHGHTAAAELLRAAVESSLGLDRGERWLAQLGLASLGHAPGAIDGLFGPRTRKAIRRFQREAGIEVTGYLTREQSKALMALGENAVRRGRGWRENTPVGGFQDCAKCPELVVVPSGSYMMGSSSDEVGRYHDEGPVHHVTISEPFAVGVSEVTRGEFGRFVRETGHRAGGGCSTYEGGKWESRSGRSWRNPGYSQTDTHPVACVSWVDAQSYVDWLSRKTGKEYRLLSESEWEYVARAGTQTSRYWGRSERGQCRHANGVDESAKRRYSGWTVISCDDGYVHTSPVRSYKLNGYGLHDVLGNVWEWVEDCWHESESYTGAPGDGDAWRSGDCNIRVLRGGAWNSSPRDVRSALRFRTTASDRHSTVGFRIARTLN